MIWWIILAFAAGSLVGTVAGYVVLIRQIWKGVRW